MLTTAIALGLFAFALDPSEVPDSLKPWQAWVIHDNQQALCARPDGNGGQDERVCAFVSSVDIDAKASGASFEQHVWLHHAGEVELVGDARHSPIDVGVDGKRAIVLPSSEGRFVVHVSGGAHKVTGRLTWKEAPESIQLPRSAALASLTQNGTKKRVASRDEDGRLWLAPPNEQKSDDGEEPSAEPELLFFRKWVDEEPALLHTKIRLTLSGKSRQLTVGNVVPEGFAVISLNSPNLPARYLASGQLIVETRAGKHDVELVAVAQKTINEARLPAGLPEGSEEIWVFEAQPRLRLVSIEDAIAIDPKQTELPAEWRKLPAYRLGLNNVLRLVEKQRGQSADERDRLQLSRALWLDFDGQGYSVKDKVTGTLSGIRRLETGTELKLGRVAEHGDNQLITEVDQKGGVELRNRDVHLEIEGRLTASSGSLPVIGYDVNMEAVQLGLHLPPGWKLFTTTGLDAAETWTQRWTLLDWFFVGLLILALHKLCGLRLAVLAGLGLVLTFTEYEAPRYAWLALCGAHALHLLLERTDPEQKSPWRRWVTIARYAGLFGFALVLLPFLATDIRLALHPQLESQHLTHHGGFGLPALGGMAAPKAALDMNEGADGMAEERAIDEEDSVAQQAEPNAAPSPVQPKSLAKKDIKRAKVAMKSNASLTQQRRGNRNLYSAAEQAAVQTGYGVVDWQFASQSLTLQGPVERSQRMHLYLMPPWLTSLTRWARCALLLLTLVWFLRRTLPPSLQPSLAFATVSKTDSNRATHTLLLAVATLFGFLLMSLLAPCQANAADSLPSQELLTELKTRLLSDPPCREHRCASLGHMSVEVAGDELVVTLEVSAVAPTLIGLPGHVSQWMPKKVELDDKPAERLWVDLDGQLHVALDKGGYKLKLRGELSTQDVISLSMPTPPLSVSLSHGKDAQGKTPSRTFSLEGLDEDGHPTEGLQLVLQSRREGGEKSDKNGKKSEEASDSRKSALAAAFVVERHLRFSMQWEVETVVSRRFASQEPATFDIELLPNETLTTPGLRQQNSRVVLGFAPSEQRQSFRSTLAQQPKLVLPTPSNPPVTQAWVYRATIEAIWHVQSEGVPLTSLPTGADQEWHPRAGEAVTLMLSRPKALVGQTLTIEQSEYTIEPGEHEANATLRLVLSSSRGGDHFITLPQGAILDQVEIDGVRTTVRREGERVALPIHPGNVSAVLLWHEQRESQLVFHPSQVSLNAPSVNAKVSVKAKERRWLWWTTGPVAGPSVLFWSLLCVVIISGIILGRIPRSPITSTQAVLLGVGVVQGGMAAAVILFGFLFALQRRSEWAPTWKSKWRYNLMQLAFLGFLLLTIATLMEALHTGLVSVPDMDIEGWGSNAQTLHWYQDRVQNQLPSVGIISLPLWSYRVVMLAWALWLAQFVQRYVKTAAQQLAAGGLWRKDRHE